MVDPWPARGPIVVIVDSVDYAGAEVYVDLLLRYLPADLPRTLVVRAPGPTRLAASAAALGLEVVAWQRGPAGLARLDRAIRGAGLVHLNMPWPGANRHAVALTWLHRRPSVATVHLYLPPANALRRRILRLAYRRFARVIAVSSHIHRSLVSELGVPTGVVRVVPNGVAPRDPAPLRRPGDHQVVRIGAMGRLTVQKGFDLLLEAIPALLADGQRVELWIAGEGPERAALEQSARGLPVRLMGPVADVEAFFAGLDVFCMPSRWEGLPFALLEAMMAGKACVAAGVGDIPEALGPAGVVVPEEDTEALAEALGALVGSPEQRRLLGMAAQRRAMERYTIDKMVATTVAVYEEVFADQPPT